MNFITIPYEVPSLNKYLTTHWAARKRTNDKLVMIIACFAKSERIPLPKPDQRRRIHFIAYRKRLMTDPSDNLPGGCKGLRDAVVRAGYLIDDSSDLADVTYEQRPCREHATKKACTVIWFDGYERPTDRIQKRATALEKKL